MNNFEISEVFSFLGKLMDINGEDSFKAKSYSSVAFAIEKLPVQLNEMPAASLATVKGIGVSSAKKITELLTTGKMEQLEKIIFSTPPGVLEMLNIKGIGPKKIHTIWKEMELESVGELLYACKENRLKLYKGFGEKTQQAVLDQIEFYLKSKGSYLYAQTISAAEDLQKLFGQLFPGKRIFVTGDFARQMEIIKSLDFIIEENLSAAESILSAQPGFELIDRKEDTLFYKTSGGLNLKIIPVQEQLIEKLVETSSSDEFMSAMKDDYSVSETAKDENHYFSLRKLSYTPAFLREDAQITTAKDHSTAHIQSSDIKGMIHCHSDWSDGTNSIEELAKACLERGMEYMAISDHSKTASYAQGLKEEKIKAQHEYIDELNQKFAPFKIFKSIESDILGDGSLDYSEKILSTFDLVIASVHSNLKMTEEKAMSRLLTAIENPFTTILGHMSGRLLLSRPGYPLDHKKIIDACDANNVVIELNANPSRLDMDWRHIKYALEKNVLISIDPDAHSIKGIDDIRYGVFSAQKAMLTKERNLSSFGLVAFENYLSERKKLKRI